MRIVDMHWSNWAFFVSFLTIIAGLDLVQIWSDVHQVVQPKIMESKSEIRTAETQNESSNRTPTAKTTVKESNSPKRAVESLQGASSEDSDSIGQLDFEPVTKEDLEGFK